MRRVCTPFCFCGAFLWKDQTMMLTKTMGEPTPSRVARIVGAVRLVVILLLLIWATARAGFSSVLSAYAARTSQLAAADAAVNVNSGDPEAHFVRGAILEANDDLAPAISEYTQALALRPDDYVLWLGLAHARELNGDSAGALAAANQAVQLAPYYAQPRWQLGNLLVRAGHQDEGFSQLRLAGAGNPTLLPTIIDLAWQFSGGNAAYVMQAI